MKITKRQLKRIIREEYRKINEVKRSVGEITFSGKYFDIQYGARGIGVAKDIYVIIHRASGKVIPTSMYKTSAREVKSLLKLIERSVGPALANPELETDFDTLHKIYGILKDWPHKQVGR